MTSKEDKKIKKEVEDVEDISIEEEQQEVSSFSGDSKKLRDKLKKCTEEKQEYLLGWQRAKADFINYKKDEEKKIETIRKYANEGIINELLSVIDSFNSAKESVFWEKADDSWKSGMLNIINQLENILKKYGLEEITEEKDFDPNLHESIEMIGGCKEEEDGKIERVLQKGYKLNGRVLRPSKVRVKIFKS